MAQAKELRALCCSPRGNGLRSMKGRPDWATQRPSSATRGFVCVRDAGGGPGRGEGGGGGPGSRGSTAGEGVRGEAGVGVHEAGSGQGARALIRRVRSAPGRRLQRQDLAAVIREGGQLPIANSSDLLLQACEAIAEAQRSLVTSAFRTPPGSAPRTPRRSDGARPCRRGAAGSLAGSEIPRPGSTRRPPRQSPARALDERR